MFKDKLYLHMSGKCEMHNKRTYDFIEICNTFDVKKNQLGNVNISIAFNQFIQDVVEDRDFCLVL